MNFTCGGQGDKNSPSVPLCRNQNLETEDDPHNLFESSFIKELFYFHGAAGSARLLLDATSCNEDEPLVCVTIRCSSWERVCSEESETLN